MVGIGSLEVTGPAVFADGAPGGHPPAATRNAQVEDLPVTLLPFHTGRAILETFRPCRLLLILCLVTMVLVCTRTLRRETFTVESRIDENWGYTLEACRKKCAEVDTTEGDCDAEDGFRIYRVEYMSRKYIRATEEEPLPKGVSDRYTLTGFCRIRHNVPRWKSLVAISVFFAAIVLVIQGGPAEVIMIGGAAILGVCGILNKDHIYSGLASGGVMGLALLFAVADTISETGLLEKVMCCILGSPSCLIVALIRLCASVTLISCFLSNTAVVALMLPVTLAWSRRINIHPGKLLMPLSFAAQLGGSVTKVASSHVLVACDVTKERYDGGRGMGMFDLTPAGLCIAVFNGAFMVAMAATPLLASSGARAAPVSGSVASSEGEDTAHYYLVRFRISRGPYVGRPLAATGLDRCPGVRTARLTSRESGAMQEGDVVEFVGDVGAVVALRQLPGLSLVNHKHLVALGAYRRKRFLYEVAVDFDSEFLSTNILQEPDRLLMEFGAVLIAGPKCTDARTPHKMWAGAVLLFEANSDWVLDRAANRWNKACSLIREVPRSSPKRLDGPIDTLRNLSVCGAMVFMIVCLTLVEHLELYVAASILLLFYLLVRAISVERLFATIQVQILLIIAGAIAFGEALTSTGVVGWIAGNVLRLASGEILVMSLVYFVAVFLGAFVNNSAVVAILAPMLESICSNDPSLSFEGLTWILTIASGTCFITPLGYQTNLMVLPGGKYSFADFVRFGAMNQLVHMVLAVTFVRLFQPKPQIGVAPLLAPGLVGNSTMQGVILA